VRPCAFYHWSRHERLRIRPSKSLSLGDQTSSLCRGGGKAQCEAARLAAETRASGLGKARRNPSPPTSAEGVCRGGIARNGSDETYVVRSSDVPLLGSCAWRARHTAKPNRTLRCSYAASIIRNSHGPKCSPDVAQWTYDSYSLGRGSRQRLDQPRDNSWFLSYQRTVSHEPREEASADVTGRGWNGRRLRFRTPRRRRDFSSYLLAGAIFQSKVIGLSSRLRTSSTVIAGLGFVIQARGHAFPALMATIVNDG